MAVTLSSDMIVPEVYADMIQAEFTGAMVLGNLGFSNDDLAGQPGDTIHFPQWNTISDATDLTENVAIVPQKLTTVDDTATIKEAGTGVEYTDTAQLVGMGNIEQESRRQLGIVLARKLDTDLMVETTSAGLPAGRTLDVTAATPDTLTWNTYVDAVATLGDGYDPALIAGLIVHSKQHADLMKDSTFISADKVDAANRPTTRGFVGTVGGVNVFRSDRGTDLGGTPKVYQAVLLLTGAIGVIYKRRPLVETDRDILSRTNVLTVTAHYAVKRRNDDGVVLIKTN